MNSHGAFTTAREMADEIRSGRYRDTQGRICSQPRELGVWRSAIVEKVCEFLAGNDSPIRVADDD